MKKILVVLAAVAFGTVAQASELWWTVSGTSVTVDDQEDVEWTTAKLFANTSTEYTQNFGGVELGTLDDAELEAGGFAITDVGTYTSFYVELLGVVEGKEAVVGRSYVSKGNANIFQNQGAITVSDSDVVNSGAYVQSIMQTPGSAYSFDKFTGSEVIPEPTSGLLVMLGVMLLGLRRKRV